MSWADAALQANATSFIEGGEPIAYVPQGGKGTPISTACLLLLNRVSQSASPGFFADIQVDPLIVTAPERNDQVTWKDGVAYVVAAVINPPYTMPILALHRKFDL